MKVFVNHQFLGRFFLRLTQYFIVLAGCSDTREREFLWVYEGLCLQCVIGIYECDMCRLCICDACVCCVQYFTCAHNAHEVCIWLVCVCMYSVYVYVGV